MRAETRFVCKHCAKRNCFEHCQEAEDGKHVPDPQSAEQADGTDWVVEYYCKLCGYSGSVSVDPKDLNWE